MRTKSFSKIILHFFITSPTQFSEIGCTSDLTFKLIGFKRSWLKYYQIIITFDRRGLMKRTHLAIGQSEINVVENMKKV